MPRTKLPTESPLFFLHITSSDLLHVPRFLVFGQEIVYGPEECDARLAKRWQQWMPTAGPPSFLTCVKWEHILYDSVLELEQSAVSGCELCRLWRRYLIYGFGELSEELLESRPVIVRKANKGGWILSGKLEISFEEQNLGSCDEEEEGIAPYSQLISQFTGSDSTTKPE